MAQIRWVLLRRQWLACGLGLLLSAAAGAQQLLAQRPPMGWNSWNRYGCDIREDLVRRQADAMVDSGMREAGYEYVIVDDCWQGSRDGAGNLQPDPGRFPSGMRALADYIHARGLRLGLYSDAGSGTCKDRPGSLGHEYQDAAQFAAWGVDYLKHDFCHGESLDARSAYQRMSDALRASGRAIVYSVSDWGASQPWLWAASVGANLWRTGGDIYDGWEGVTHDGQWFGVLDILDRQVGLDVYAGPGHWNDPDMLEVGNGGMSAAEYRAHFALWAMLAAPLIAGNDLGAMDATTRDILTAREVIAVDQDPLGVEAHRAFKCDDLEVWVRPLVGAAQAVAVLNRGIALRSLRLDASMLQRPASVWLEVRDLWSGANLPPARGGFTLDVPAHSVRLLRVVAPAHSRASPKGF